VIYLFTQGGDVINLLHKESDSYLTAEGSFTGLGEFEDVHMRRRKEKSKDSTIHCNLGITFWQVSLFSPSFLFYFIFYFSLCDNRWSILTTARLVRSSAGTSGSDSATCAQNATCASSKPARIHMSSVLH